MVECQCCGYPGPDFNRCPNCKFPIAPWQKATFDLHRHPYYPDILWTDCKACRKENYNANLDSDTDDPYGYGYVSDTAN